MSKYEYGKDTPLERAKENLKRLSARLKKTNEIGKECLEMVGGDQWTDDEITSREDTNRPIITINKLANNVNVVVNKQADNMARIKVAPFEDADKDTANVINGLLRHIQYSDKSDALEAFSHGFFCLVSSGKGFWRVETEYTDEMSFEQEILISKIDCPNSVYEDPEGMCTFVVSFMSEDEYEAKYGKEEYEHSGSWDMDNIAKPTTEEDVMVVEYWEVTEKEYEIVKVEIPEQIEISQGEVSIDDAIVATMQPQQQVIPPSIQVILKEELESMPVGTVILDERKTKKRTIKQYIFCGDEVIEENDWAGKYIPIIGVYSREFTLRNGEKFFKPLVYDALDPQRMYNFDKSQQAEYLQMAPKAPWVGFEGQFDGHEDEFSNANSSHVPYLESKPVVHEGQLLPPPKRSEAPQFPAAFTQTMMQDADEIKSTLGIFDASLGAQGNESSGRAIIARKQQGDLSTGHFNMFMNRGMRRTGLVLVDLIPRIYDTARTIRILGDDMTDKVVKINQNAVDEEGQPYLYDLTAGKYDVKIEAGPSAVTRRQENFDSIIEMTKVVPMIAQTAPDLIVRNADFEYTDEISARIQAALPPGLISKAEQIKNGDKGGPTQEQMALQQMGQQMQQMQGVMQKLGQENEQLKKRDQQLQLTIAQLKERGSLLREQLKSQTDVRIAEMDNRADIQQEIIRQQGRNNVVLPPARNSSTPGQRVAVPVPPAVNRPM